ncbi:MULTISPECIES: spermidine N1-acetyltransferase [Aeromonas]|jgi:diamine N-acetyltransferase|uniref:Spermidine N(1)-acetyltransferase n=4 Tax=Bacteria TaxID=2 RepID=A0A3L0W3J8_ECOLX|nr:MULTISPECIES: spermidine N1-acetyltransferase [Aeromonas]MBP6384615.1 spermidine N1-acetyltransferase [Aeromonas sp.]ARW81627.1 Spermidine N1-acetyltransferase [Aeromonas salmonicida]ASI23847.1 spermidine acetyltransferase [Aeromonas salmonicida]ASI28167.1 spermidine acetyltransferase [Aeromonas salmonicida]ASI32299.1 spermidine acetyltransferase [Aeromonas salmonicida]
MPCRDTLSLRPLEREDLKFVHQLNNNASIMRYWFEEPYEAYMELAQLYDKHIHDQQERRFILEVEGTNVGLVELVDIRSIHRRAEFQIIIAPAYQGLGYAKTATLKAMKYAFNVLNLHKLYLIVDSDNAKARHVYQSLGFAPEGELKEEFFIDGKYRTAIRMCLFQRDFQANAANRV